MAETEKPRRLWKVVLVCSLALNLAIAGVVVGSALSGRIGDGPPRSFDLGVGPLARALEQDERREIGRALRQGRVLRGLDPRARADELVTLLLADPFDPEALQDLFARQSADLQRVQSRAQEALIATIVAMTPDRRAAFAAAIAAEAERGRTRAGPRSGG